MMHGSGAQDDGAENNWSAGVPVSSDVRGAGMHLRNDLVSTAISFLLNERVRDKSEDQKRIFLIRKGLTAEEIEVAIDCASRGLPLTSRIPDKRSSGGSLHHLDHERNSCVSPQVYRHEILYQYPGTFAMTRALVPSFILMSGIFYGLYLLYRRFQHLIFPRKQEKHPLLLVQEALQQLTDVCDSMNKSIRELEENIVTRMRNEMQSLTRPSAEAQAAVNEIKKELSSIKALLLGRKQFPESPPLTQVSIPAWQMTDESKDRQ